MNIEKLLNIAQPIFVIIAAIIGGVWAIFRFWKFGELKKAKAELKILQDSLTKRGELNIKMTNHEIVNDLGIKHLTNIAVEIENFGNKSETLLWKKGVVKYAMINKISETEIVFGECKSVKILGWDSYRMASVISAGQNSVFNFLLPINQPGLYYIEFEVSASTETSDRHLTEVNKFMETENLSGFWTIDEFINIPS